MKKLFWLSDLTHVFWSRGSCGQTPARSSIFSKLLCQILKFTTSFTDIENIVRKHAKQFNGGSFKSRITSICTFVVILADWRFCQILQMCLTLVFILTLCILSFPCVVHNKLCFYIYYLHMFLDSSYNIYLFHFYFLFTIGISTYIEKFFFILLRVLSH